MHGFSTALIIVMMSLTACNNNSFEETQVPAPITAPQDEQKTPDTDQPEDEPEMPVNPPTNPSEPANPSEPTNPITEPTDPITNPNPIEPTPELPFAVCSKLNFKDVTWPLELDLFEQEMFKLSLNLSGQFEGHDGWSNITNNFDNTGLSMGLLNQTLGTGSLQPLLAKMRVHNYPVMNQVFAKERFDSISGMLEPWLSSVNVQSYEDLDYSPLDKEWNDRVNAFATSKTQKSVQWAMNNLYTSSGVNKPFKKEWKKELQDLANTPQYVSLQLEAAQRYHNKAMIYVDLIGVRDLRTYLFMFDVIVQNGGIKQSEFNEALEWRRSNPDSTDTDLLLTLLEIRLRRTIPKWAPDVRARKTAMIMGKGKVHGSNRNFEKEYCYKSSIPLQ